jgi:hypothetical protein
MKQGAEAPTLAGAIENGWCQRKLPTLWSKTNVTMDNHHCFMGISTNYFDRHVQ